MKGRTARCRVERLEDRTLFSLPFGSGATSSITLNPTHSAALVNIVSGPLLSADFNNDGKADLVFGGRGGADTNTAYVGVMLGSSTGAFTDAGTLTAPISVGAALPQSSNLIVSPFAVGAGSAPSISSYAVGDFNADGNQDLAAVYTVSSNGGFIYKVVFGFGNGDGTFTPQTPVQFDFTSFVPSNDPLPPAGLAVGKFTGDKDQLAMVVPNDANTESLDIIGMDDTNHLNGLEGVFLTGFSGGDDQVVAGHFNSDALTDLAVYDPVASQVQILTSLGGDNFKHNSVISIAPPPANASSSRIAAGDFNRDGKTDLVIQQAASGTNANTLNVLLSDGNGGLTALTPVADGPGLTGTTLDWLAVGDFDGVDQVGVATRYGVFRPDAAGVLQYSGLSTFTDTQGNNAVAADFNGDGATDLVAVVDAPQNNPATIELKLGATSPTLNDFTTNLVDQSAKNAFGADVTAQFSVTVGGANGTPTGTVDFYAINASDNSVVDLGTAALINGVATLSPSNMPVATENVFAAYSGDATYLAGVSDNITVAYAGGGGVAVTSSLESGITKSTLPGIVLAGAKLNKSITVSVKNTGATLFNQKTTINLFASHDTTVDPSDILIASLTKALKIPAGKTVNLVIPLKTLPSGLDGIYTMLEETVQSGIQTSVSLTGRDFEVLPPLISLDPTIIGTPISRTGSMTIDVSVKNNGNIPSAGTSQVLIYASPDTTVASGTVLLKKVIGIHLKPGAKTLLKLLLNPLETQLSQASAHVIVEVIDSTGRATTTYTGSAPLG